MKRLSLVIALFALALLFGCTANQSTLDVARNDPLIKDFLSAYPDAEATSAFVKSSVVGADSGFKENCPNAPVADAYKITFSDAKSGAQAIAFVDVNRVICSYAVGLAPNGCAETWTCTAWGPEPCGEGGVQFRTCTDSSKCGTIKSKPAEEKDCQYAGACRENWTCGGWTACSNSLQTRTCTDSNSCGTTANKPAVSQSCVPGCTEKWVCGSWTGCSGNLQTRTCSDANSCGTTVSRPPLAQTCSMPCANSWSCGAWGSCLNNAQARTCTDANSCGNDVNKPAVSQGCSNVLKELSVGQSLSVAGAGSYVGKTLTIDLNAIVLVSSTYQAKWILKDGNTVVGSPVQKAPTYDLRDEFGTSYIGADRVYVKSIDSNGTKVTVNQFSKVVELRNGEVFPYDSSATSNPAWKAYIGNNGSAVTGISVKSNRSYSQALTETDSSKFMLQKDGNLNLPLNYVSMAYSGLSSASAYSATIGGAESIALTDTSGVSRSLPLSLQLSQGANVVTIAGKSFSVDVNESNNPATLKYWDMVVGDTGTAAGFTQVALRDANIATDSPIDFAVNSTWQNSVGTGKVRYYAGTVSATHRYWLFLSAQTFGMPKGSIIFDGTYLTDSDLRSYYLPDHMTYSALTLAGFSKTPDEGDSFAFTGVFGLINEPSTGERTSFYVDTSPGLLVNSTDGKSRLAAADNEAEHPYFSLNEYSALEASRLTQGYTTYGSKINVSGGTATMLVPSDHLSPGITITQAKSGGTGTYTTGNTLWISNTLSPISQPVTKTLDSTSSYYADSFFISPNPVLQTLALSGAIGKGEVLLKLNPGDVNYAAAYSAPIPYGYYEADYNIPTALMGKNYSVLESSATKLVLADVS